MPKFDFIDVRIPDDFSTLERVADFTVDVAKGAVCGVVTGTAATAEDALKGTLKLAHGDIVGAAKIVEDRAVGIVTGTLGAVESGIAVAQAGADAVMHGRDFLTEENKVHMTRLCRLGIYSALAGAVLGDSAPEGSHCDVPGDACSLPYVENGVFTGDEADLQALIEAGEDPDAAHVPAADVVRSEAVKAEFLRAHGIDDAEGWQVHHIQPVSMGGDDAPENMVLIDPENHAAVTAAHERFYEWTKR